MVLHALVKPKYFVPVHGEYKMLKCHEKLAMDLGMDKKNVFVMANGDCLELNKQSAKLTFRTLSLVVRYLLVVLA